MKELIYIFPGVEIKLSLKLLTNLTMCRGDCGLRLYPNGQINFICLQREETLIQRFSLRPS